MLDWELKLQEQKDIKQSLEKEIKQLEKQNAVQGIKIQKAHDTEDRTTKLKALTEELRVWKQKVAMLMASLEKEHSLRKDQQVKIQKIQEQAQQLEKQQSKVNLEAERERERQEREQQLREQQEKEQVRQELEQNLKNFKKQEAMALEQNRVLQAELDQLNMQLKEKEQIHRISQYKLNELKRSLKHNQLKPLN